jgi:hypothetical protein
MECKNSGFKKIYQAIFKKYQEIELYIFLTRRFYLNC